jgi:hypothetical protein
MEVDDAHSLDALPLVPVEQVQRELVGLAAEPCGSAVVSGSCGVVIWGGHLLTATVTASLGDGKGETLAGVVDALAGFACEAPCCAEGSSGCASSMEWSPS